MLCFLIALFIGTSCEAPRPVCPELRSEVRPVYESAARYYAEGHFASGETFTLTGKDGTIYNGTMATVTIDRLGKQWVQIGTTTDEEAIEFNKRVQECRTLNGEF